MRLRILQSHQDTSISYILISSYLFHLILSILISSHPSLLYIDLDTRSTITNHHHFIRHFSALGHLGLIHRYCVQDRHPFLLYSGVEMLGPDVAFEGPAPVPAGKTVALLFSTLKCSRHFIIVSFPRISTFSRSFRIGPDHHWRW